MQERLEKEGVKVKMTKFLILTKYSGIRVFWMNCKKKILFICKPIESFHVCYYMQNFLTDKFFKMISRLFLIFSMFISLASVHAQSIKGIWKSVDDADGREKSHIEIYEEGGKFKGKVIKLLPGATATHCNSCKGNLKINR